MQVVRDAGIRLRKRIFRNRTSVIELANALIALGFSLMFILTGDALVEDKAFDHFLVIKSIWIWLLIAVMSIIHLLTISRDSLISRRVSSLILKFSGFFWAIDAVLFGFSSTINPDFITCSILSLITLLAAYEIDDENIKRALLRDAVKGS